MKKLLIPLLFAGLAVGCNGDALAPPTDDVSLVASVVAGCQAVRFDVALVLGPGGGVGTVTGDLVGTIETEFPNAGVWHGKAFLNDGIDFIKVGSSSVPGLAGQTIELRHDNMAVGASGNLTFHGTFDISPPPPFAVDLTYRGNICVGY
jgi:hypothetical protein